MYQFSRKDKQEEIEAAEGALMTGKLPLKTKRSEDPYPHSAYTNGIELLLAANKSLRRSPT